MRGSTDRARADLAAHIAQMELNEREFARLLGAAQGMVTDVALREALRAHESETLRQAANMTEALILLDARPEPLPCPMPEELRAELLAAVRAIDAPSSPLLTSAVLQSAARSERYEIDTYRALRAFARSHGARTIVELLEENLGGEVAMLAQLEWLANRHAPAL